MFRSRMGRYSQQHKFAEVGRLWSSSLATLFSSIQSVCLNNRTDLLVSCSTGKDCFIVELSSFDCILFTSYTSISAYDLWYQCVVYAWPGANIVFSYDYTTHLFLFLWCTACSIQSLCAQPSKVKVGSGIIHCLALCMIWCEHRGSHLLITKICFVL